MTKLALSDEILMKIDKPARYIGNELNSIKKDKEKVAIRFAMCFPDVYEIGMSHLGVQILYDMFNKMEDVWCERVYSPWPDLHKNRKYTPIFKQKVIEYKCADRTLIAQMLCRLSVLAALIPAIRDLTINPLVWTDGGAAAIDADVNLNEAPVESEPGYPHLTVCAPPWEEGREVVFGGEALTLRTFVQSDFHPLKHFLGRLSEKTFYLRFHTSVHLSDERICELASLDYAREAAWALAKDGEIHAVARWRLTGELGEAEFGIVVEDAWQRRGLARVLMAHIETTASERGVTRLVGHVLKGNEAMQGMMTAMGYTLGEGDSRDTDPWVKDISIPTNLL